MYGLRGYRDLSKCCSNPALDIQHRRFILKAPTLARRPSRLEMVVSGAITDDRNANSATKSDVTRLRRERHTVPRAIERNAAQSPDPNNIHQQDIWSSRGSGAGAFVASPRIGLLRRLRARSLFCAEASSCLLGSGAGLSGKSGTATEITRLRRYLLRATGKNPREETH